MSPRIRPIVASLIVVCTLAGSSGCAMFREPQKIETVDDYLALPRVKTTKAADNYALKSSKSSRKK